MQRTESQESVFSFHNEIQGSNSSHQVCLVINAFNPLSGLTVSDFLSTLKLGPKKFAFQYRGSSKIKKIVTYLKELKLGPQNDVRTPLFGNIHSSQNTGTSPYPSANEGLKRGYIHMMDYHSASHRKGILPFVTAIDKPGVK